MDSRYGGRAHRPVHELQCLFSQYRHQEFDEEVWQEQTLRLDLNTGQKEGNVQNQYV